MFPENVIQATMQQIQTTYNVVNKTRVGDIIKYKMVYKDGVNILGMDAKR